METYRGYIDTTDDALLIIEASRLGVLQRVSRRLCNDERKHIKSGSVFVWDENESGIRRWTDGKRWSPSRVNGCFLIYTELEPKSNGSSIQGEKRKKPDGGDNSSSNRVSDIPKPNGLIKKALSLFTAHNSKLHLVCYYNKDDLNSGRLITPMQDQRINTLSIPRSLYPDVVPELIHVVASQSAAGYPPRLASDTSGSSEYSTASSHVYNGLGIASSSSQFTTNSPEAHLVVSRSEPLYEDNVRNYQHRQSNSLINTVASGRTTPHHYYNTQRQHPYQHHNYHSSQPQYPFSAGLQQPDYDSQYSSRAISPLDPPRYSYTMPLRTQSTHPPFSYHHHPPSRTSSPLHFIQQPPSFGRRTSMRTTFNGSEMFYQPPLSSATNIHDNYQVHNVENRSQSEIKQLGYQSNPHLPLANRQFPPEATASLPSLTQRQYTNSGKNNVPPNYILQSGDSSVGGVTSTNSAMDSDSQKGESVKRSAPPNDSHEVRDGAQKFRLPPISDLISALDK